MKRLGYVYPFAALALVLTLSTSLSALSAASPESATEKARISLLEVPEQTGDCTKSCGVDPNG